MKRRILNRGICALLCAILALQLPCQAFAASFGGKTYVKEIVLSYGDTPEQAKQWLTGKGYQVIDCNINEGADDTFSDERAVYIGYKTTSDADEAITDIRLMNMNGGYSVQDYQVMLADQKANIRTFLNRFLTAVKEYRANYAKGQPRAVAAHDMLNLLYDDDTEQNMGDLLLQKVKEEYTEKDFAALSAAEQEEHADMTTILMQSNATAVLAIEQLIALAADDEDSTWAERYADALTYDEMTEQVMEEENADPAKAMNILAARYDGDAKAIASKVADYRDYLKVYTEENVSLESIEEELNAYREKAGDVNLSAWYTAGAQYELLNNLTDADGFSLLDILTDDAYDLEGEDRCLLYPLVSVLTEGQRACLDFLPLYQIVSVGMNGDDAVANAMEHLALTESDGGISVYDGVDRSIFSENVALTGAAYRLQASSDKDYAANWFSDGISDITKVLYISLGVSIAATIGTFTASSLFRSAYLKASNDFSRRLEGEIIEAEMDYLTENDIAEIVANIDDAAEGEATQKLLEEGNLIIESQDNALLSIGSARYWSEVFRYVGIGMTAISIIIMGISLWRTYEDLKAYYNVEFTPIPMHMVNQGEGENGEKVFTYYTAVKCNRQEAQLVTEKNKILKGFGDINGDVGKQWVALYTTKDKAAGDPVTAKFKTQYGSADIPGNTTALSLFGESAAQNLTNNKSGFTYADSKGGIYLFYGTDDSAYAGSAVSGGSYALMAGGSAAAVGLAAYFLAKRKPKQNSETQEEAEENA